MWENIFRYFKHFGDASNVFLGSKSDSIRLQLTLRTLMYILFILGIAGSLFWELRRSQDLEYALFHILFHVLYFGFVIWFISLDGKLFEKLAGIPKVETLGKKSEELSNEKLSLLKELKEKQDIIDSLRTELDKATTEVAEQNKQLRELSDEEANWTSSLDDAENDLKREKELHEQTKRSKLEGVSLSELISHLTSRFDTDIEVSEQEQNSLAVMYACMHEKVPDMKRVKELSLVPFEVQEAQKIQVVSEQYSKLITEAENDDTLSSSEKRDKIKLYRMAREHALTGGDEAQ